MSTNTTNQKSSEYNKAIALVKERITGHRKGLPDVPAYKHSLRVGELLRKQDGYDSNSALAGLLHDIVEDGGVSLEELKTRGFNDEIVHLVDLCSHDSNIKDSNIRWVNMVAGLANERNTQAWNIKLADIYDNLQDSHMLNPERRRFMVETKAPLLLALTKDKLSNTELWQNLQERTEMLRKQDQTKVSAVIIQNTIPPNRNRGC
jgi:(p)ppGpp synthase/HD superfamily hydrolase